MIEFKGSHFERDVILWAVRWYAAYPVSYRQLEEMMQERGVGLTIRRSIAAHANMSRCWISNCVHASIW